jgi:hypothetical protein
MDFQRLLARMVELDQPVKECEDMSVSPTTPPIPPTTPPSMSVNLNAQGIDSIESLLKLMTKVNPDMINQPTPAPIPSLSPEPMPGVGDLGNLDTGPLKMLPDFDLDNDNKPDGEMSTDYNKDGELDSHEKDHADEKPLLKSLDLDKDGDHDMDDHDMEKKETYANEPDEEYADVDYVVNKVAGGMNKPHGTYPKVAGGDNPMQRVKEGNDLRSQIKAELAQRLAEAKGAK